jgi:hypothetical protein
VINTKCRIDGNVGGVQVPSIKDGQGASGSGAIQNPGKTIVLHLAAKAVQRVNAMRDANRIGDACKATIRCGPSLDVTV